MSHKREVVLSRPRIDVSSAVVEAEHVVDLPCAAERVTMIVRDQGDVWPELPRPTTATCAAQAYRQAPVVRCTIEFHDGGRS
jgi:hypothetical protein